MPKFRTLCLLALAAALAPAATARAHFLWVTIEDEAGSPALVSAFLAETPVPEGPEFLKFVRGVRPEVDGRPLASAAGEDAVEARWSGPLPGSVEARKDLGVTRRGETAFRLVYTARAQAAPVAPDAPEALGGLRARLVAAEGRGPRLQVLFDGKPVPGARVKVYPELGDPHEAAAGDDGTLEVEGLADGSAAVWANHVEAAPGTLDGQDYAETRHYASLTVRPATASSAADSADAPALAPIPGDGVNSFGGAVLDGWLYVDSGHVGRTHRYSTETTSRHFRRLDLADGRTWEDLPLRGDAQGVALVSDGRYLYRTGGMSARNAPGTPHDLHSTADFARFDPTTKAWADLPPMPEPRSTHDAAIVGRTLYVVGGWTMKGASEEAEFCEGMLAFDLDRPEAGWRRVDQPFHRRALAAAEAGGKLYVLGGLTDEMSTVRAVDIYDPATGTWSTGPDLPGSGKADGFAPSAFGIEGRLYHSGASGRIYRLSADGREWEALGAWREPRITHRLLPGPGRTILAVGGNAKGRPTATIESAPLPPEPAAGPDVARAGD